MHKWYASFWTDTHTHTQTHRQIVYINGWDTVCVQSATNEILEIGQRPSAVRKFDGKYNQISKWNFSRLYRNWTPPPSSPQSNRFYLYIYLRLAALLSREFSRVSYYLWDNVDDPIRSVAQQLTVNWTIPPFRQLLFCGLRSIGLMRLIRR